MAQLKYRKHRLSRVVRVVPEYNKELVEKVTQKSIQLTKQGVRDLNSLGASDPVPQYNAALMCNHKWECMGDYDRCKKCDLSDPCDHACASIDFSSSHSYRGV